MAPRKLTDVCLESILWNKVPVELREVKEITTDGSVHELLQKLRAEAVIYRSVPGEKKPRIVSP